MISWREEHQTECLFLVNTKLSLHWLTPCPKRHETLKLRHDIKEYDNGRFRFQGNRSKDKGT